MGDDGGMEDKTIGFTTRYNSAWDDDTIPDGWTEWNTDGESIIIDNYIKKHNDGKKFSDYVDYVNIMFYDQSPDDLDAPQTGPELKNYKKVLEAFEKLFPKEKLIMGFVPGPQWNNGVWEGPETDKKVIDYLKSEGYGGIFFWAINQPKVGGNALPLADYAKN